MTDGGGSTFETVITAMTRVRKKAIALPVTPRTDDSRLTKRETEILRLIATGFTGRQIAEKLFISERTVDTHRTRIRNKTRCRNGASLTRWAMERGMLDEKQGK